MFADDTLIFSKAKDEDNLVLMDELSKYELVSGQKINFDKSYFLFASDTSVNVRNKIAQICNIQVEAFSEKYWTCLQWWEDKKIIPFSPSRIESERELKGGKRNYYLKEVRKY